MSIKRKTLSAKRIQRGTVGNFFVFGVLALLLVVGITAVGGLPPQSYPNEGQIVNIITPTRGADYNNLQLKTFGYVTLAPPHSSSICSSSANSEKEILIGYLPGLGQSVSSTGQIKVWVNDESPPFISPGEQVDKATGQITKAGNRAVKAEDGYLYEPALYIAPQTVEAGSSPFFPNLVKGDYNNSPPLIGHLSKSVPIEQPPPGSKPIGGPNPNGPEANIYKSEFIWNVSSIGLTTGTYQAEFLIHDGDHDRGIGCVSLVIQ
ncbi:MAG TPA: hypothetical protein VNW29_04775 [Candidatus Sulfotelmatobacter sp.]|jgi:hypothetical protein|nr:hypothetical protein [Candidatus Sulfotelmatobacter sp.]